jgi:DNA helicase II / ATP-dependent DNA helicase PcrA
MYRFPRAVILSILEHLFELWRSQTEFLNELNAQQREAATHGRGPLLVVAGAGTGKTRTLACRVAWLLGEGTPPERILLLTFSRRAAREMLHRTDLARGERDGRRVWGGTFHAVANRLLRQHGRSLGLSPDFTVMDQADGADMLNLLRDELGLATRDRRFPRKETLIAIYSRSVNAGQSLGEVLSHHFPWCADEREDIAQLFRRYVIRKREQHVLDYDDLLLYWAALLRSSAGTRVAEAFDHVLVDEYQDTNERQAEILRLLAVPTKSLMVVGDDAQAIYSFRAATIRNILEFPEQFAGAAVIRLEQNYRSTPALLDASNAVIALATERHAKTLWSRREGERRPVLLTCVDEADQSDAVCRHLLAHREQGIALRRQAVLFRTGHHSDLLELELARRNIPFVKYGGLKFLESAHVKDALALLRILANPLDEVSWFRVLQLLDGVGPAVARRMIAELGVRGERGAVGAGPVARLLRAPPAVPASAAVDLASLRDAFADCLDQSRRPSAQVERLRRFLEPVFDRVYEHPASRLRDLDQLELMAERSSSREQFLADLALDPPTSTSDLAGPPLLDEDYVVLSTIHSAKGGEWDVVHVIHAADGMIPSDMATGDEESIEEERRLFYVALTRARDMLYVYFPLRYYRRPRGQDDAHAYAQLTRFLPEHVRTRFDEQTTETGAAELASVGASPEAGPAVGVEEFVRSLWDG